MITKLKCTALFLITLFSLTRAMADTTEVCTNDNVSVVIQKQSEAKLKQIDFYLNGELYASDAGPFRSSPCHVKGFLSSGKVFSYGGCYPFGQPEAKHLTLNETNESYDLNQFRCETQISQIAAPLTQPCCNPCSDVARPGSCKGRLLCAHQGSCH